MKEKTREMIGHSRRTALTMGAGALLSPLLQTMPGKPALAKEAQGFNIVFVFTDQERYHKGWPKNLSLPGHERLAKTGTTFHNHLCPAVMCTSSRAVLMTGLQTRDSGMFENVDTPWVKSLSPKIPTIGHMLRKAGYYTAYKGKWHLSREFDVKDPTSFLNEEMEQYGFSDLFSPGDIIGHTLGGYSFDHLIAGSAITWLRRKGRPMSDEGKPWSLFVSLVNPHDIMYFNTDRPDQQVQDSGKLLMHAARAPENAHYRAEWDFDLPKSLKEPLDAPGRPKAHAEFLRLWDYTLGNIPMEEERWRRFNNYYLNCIRSVDEQIAALLSELDDLGLTERTIIVFTADHGEMAGAHGLRGKGPFAYHETMHLPLYVVHPDGKGGSDSEALTSHIDLVPSLLSLAGVNADQAATLAGRELPGKDISAAIGSTNRDQHLVRDAALFTYSGIATNDADLIRLVAEAKAAGKDPKEELKRTGFTPNLKKRGTLRSAFDGRYKLNRYFSPLDHNEPKDSDELFKWNDVELFDLSRDPHELNNLALDKEAHKDQLTAMNNLLNRLIKDEFGKDDGSELPDLPGITWTIDRVDM